MMLIKEVKSNLCYYDLRNPDAIVDEKTAKENKKDYEHCYCDNCFRGRTKLAELILKLYKRLDIK